MRGEIEDKEKLTASASGEWRVKGHVLVLAIKDGARGIFPSSGRLAVLGACDDDMTVTDGSKTFRFERS